MNEIWARTLIDMSITANFLLSEFVRKVRISLQEKSDVYAVTDIDKKSLEYNKDMINHKTEETQLQIKSHINDMQFDIMLISRHDVVLELS